MGEALIVNNNNDDTDRFLFWGSSIVKAKEEEC